MEGLICGSDVAFCCRFAIVCEGWLDLYASTYSTRSSVLISSEIPETLESLSAVIVRPPVSSVTCVSNFFPSFSSMVLNTGAGILSKMPIEYMSTLASSASFAM